jgi:hypothetical protein
MASRQYIIPTGSMSQSKQEDYRIKAIAAGLVRAHDKKIASIGDEEIGNYSRLGTVEEKLTAVLRYLQTGGWPRGFDAREAQPITDFGSALDQWNTAALAVVGTAYSCHQAVAAPALAANRLAVYYKVGIETVALPVSRIIFRMNAANGNIVALFDLEQLVNRLETDGWFSEPVVIDPSQAHAVQVLCRIATGVLARVQLGCYIIEPAGTLIA